MEKKRSKKMLLVNAPPDKYFCAKDGKILKNLFDLSRAFEEMNEETYRHHAKEEKNDFSRWVSDVFGEHRLAKRITTANTREKSQIAVLKHMLSVRTKR